MAAQLEQKSAQDLGALAAQKIAAQRAAQEEKDRQAAHALAVASFNQNDRHFNVTAAGTGREHDLQCWEKEDAVKAAHEVRRHRCRMRSRSAA